MDAPRKATPGSDWVTAAEHETGSRPIDAGFGLIGDINGGGPRVVAETIDEAVTLRDL